MATATHPLIRHIRRLAGTQPAAELPDAHLLARFAACGDESAFELLVRRHGPLVLGVCRRVLGDWHAAEDCFQIAFALLAQKAGTLRQPERLGPWLFGVAYRTAQKARARAARRDVCERQAARTAAVEATEDAVWRDLRPVLDNAVARLPEKYRAAFVLHYLQGASVDEVARRLDMPRGTVATRLARAREQLRKGLARRGLTLSGAALTTALSVDAVSATVPSRLKALVVQAATRVLADPAMVTGTAAGVAALGNGGLNTMPTIKKTLVAVLLLAALSAGGTSWPTLGAAAQKPEGVATQPGAVEGKPPAAVNEPRNGDIEETIYRALREKGLWQGGGGYTVFVKRVQARRLIDVVIVHCAGPQGIPDVGWARQGSLRLDRKHGQVFLDLADAQFTTPEAIGHFNRKTLPVPLPTARVFQDWTIGLALGQKTARPELALAQAEKAFKVAEFYRKTGRLGSARFYYELVRRRYAGTSFAARAAEYLCDEDPRKSLEREAERFGAQFPKLLRKLDKEADNQKEQPAQKRKIRRWIPIDGDTVILPPLEPGKRRSCDGPPDQATILRALPRVAKSVPGVYEESREDVEFTVNKLVDRIDPPRFYPLVGPAQLHHCHYKCVVYFNETVKVSWPFAFECKCRRSEVVYIDRDHLHLVREADWFGKRP